MSRNKELLTCKICSKQAKNLGAHLYYSHPNLSVKDYYDKYLKQPGEGICVTCGKPIAFRTIRKGYGKHCSAKCNQNDKAVREKQEKTNLIKYDNKYACATTYSKEKTKQTKIARYGDVNYNNSQKMKQTKLDKYGEYYINPDKTKKTNLEKYGVECSFQSRDVRLKALKNMRKNGNRSSLEDYLEQFFINNKINYKQEYNIDSRYPYFCDFYLPDSDTFIEINNYWTHGKHFYDKNNLNDIKVLNNWTEKANLGQKGYNGAIYVWTVLDVEKRQCAINNNINYIVLWNKKDIDNFISLYKI